MFPSFFNNKFDLVFNFGVLPGKILEDSKRKCFYGNRFTRRGDILKTKVHDLAMKFFWDRDMLQKPYRISFDRIMNTGFV